MNKIIISSLLLLISPSLVSASLNKTTEESTSQTVVTSGSNIFNDTTTETVSTSTLTTEIIKEYSYDSQQNAETDTSNSQSLIMETTNETIEQPIPPTTKPAITVTKKAKHSATIVPKQETQSSNKTGTTKTNVTTTTIKKMANSTSTTPNTKKVVKKTNTPPQGKYYAFNRYVTVLKGKTNTWQNFNWVKKYDNAKIANKTYLAKGYYKHQNGTTYYSLYNNKGTWMGYISAGAIQQASGAQGKYFAYNKYVTVLKGKNNTWQNFNWVKKFNNTKVANNSYLAKGYYNHANGSTYYSLYNNKGTWMGYIKASATKPTPPKAAPIKETNFAKLKEKTPTYSASMSKKFEQAVNNYRQSKKRYVLPIKSSLQTTAKKEASKNTNTNYLKWTANHGRDGISTTFTIIGATNEKKAVEKCLSNFKNSPQHNKNLLDANRQYTASFGGAVYVMKTTINGTPVYQFVFNGYFGTNY
ncbi:hypothetical protein [Vagococcus xieshaowenii]|uniref:SCP domain-containing protein n=1 Tax=Vagococcus xieshaowenii TaxID=2562451 RepID=A0AAJ5JMP1_9ENTE|nr:hypothetical protein [Vagococcus xieshaowenii]QCA28460.1 hypothetical protein E4Z98_03705 [Vagococcus xieshaowenii]TFZ42785.1 hypothetical protein E4031_02035 [Vagococcus xieshaowenii]